MKRSELQSYIANLPVGTDLFRSAVEETELPGAIDPKKIPDGIVTGSNLVEFEGEVDPVLRSAVALSLLAAQRVADQDVVITDPDQWIERHNTVLRNLGWVVEGGGSVEQEFKEINVGVHQAIIPLLTAALGGAVAASSLIITALEQLQKINKDSPWITLFDKESRRFGVSEYHFTRVSADRSKVVMNVVAARFDATYGRTQVLFFKVTKQHAKFDMANSSMSAEGDLLKMSNDALKSKLGRIINQYVKELDIGA